jgi:hypothetical protein
MTPKFQENAVATLSRVRGIFEERGGQYGDTWRNCQFLTMKAVAEKYGIKIDSKFYRALATAAFVDKKYARLEGGYRDDNLIDGIAYQAYLAEEVRQLDLSLINTNEAAKG